MKNNADQSVEYMSALVALAKAMDEVVSAQAKLIQTLSPHARTIISARSILANNVSKKINKSGLYAEAEPNYAL